MAEAVEGACLPSAVTPRGRLERCGIEESQEPEVRQTPPAHRRMLVYRVVGTVLTAATVICLITYLVYEREALQAAVNRLSYLAFAGVVATLIVQWGARTARDQLIYQELGYTVSFYRLFYVVLVQTLLNYLPMKPGTVYAAYALRRHAGLELPHFGAVVLVHNLLMVVMAAGSAAAVIAFHPASRTAGGRIALAFLIAVTLLSVLSALLLPRLALQLPCRLCNIGEKLGAGFAIMRRHPSVLYSTLGLSALTFIISCLRLYVLYGCTSQSISLLESVVVSAAGQLALVLSLTPAAIGIRELLVGISSPLVAASTAAGIIAASLERAIILLSLVVIVLPVQGRMLWGYFSMTNRLGNAAKEL